MSADSRRRIFALLFLALPTALAIHADPAAAQAKQVDPARVEALAARLDEIRARLALTEEQQAAVEPILRESLARRAALAERARAEGRPSRRELRRLREEADQIRKETRTRIAPILTPVQLAEYDRIQDELRQEARERLRARRRSR
ncbi:hypothetical protein [Amphiplicatus metriothermophilus]|uniref:LTXXQ motif family protein n=1 Tax=Amphiplicatus metriothermophilus TaxID=1519374 RepID=A0A239PL40_9PROT|nr:hypothetical protein [Amphiplicatus metriothermophilus]MBB5517375.1 Spy/CpxP family protein refolding chaperone [Amphiplicatus metriothermophilus]SNT68290.1 hypothetical protein SAMN06297382_0791 [Amphiplicatus metriothermophilus]